EQSRCEPLANEATLGKSANRCKAVTDDRLGVPDNIGDHRYHTRVKPPRRHGWVGITGDRYGNFSYIDDAHQWSSFRSSHRPASHAEATRSIAASVDWAYGHNARLFGDPTVAAVPLAAPVNARGLCSDDADRLPPHLLCWKDHTGYVPVPEKAIRTILPDL